MYDYRSRKRSAWSSDVFSILPTELRVKTCIIHKRDNGKYQVKREGETYLQDSQTVRELLARLPYGIGSADVVQDGKDVIVCLRDRTIQVSEYVFLRDEFPERLLFDKEEDFDFAPITPHRKNF